jgi:hypothetical protein
MYVISFYDETNFPPIQNDTRYANENHRNINVVMSL